MSVVVQFRLVSQTSSRMLSILLGLHWGRFFARMFFTWIQQKMSRW